MLKIQLLAHNSVKAEVKGTLRELGTVEITEIGDLKGHKGDAVPGGGVDRTDIEAKIEKLESSISILEDYREKVSLLERLGKGPLLVSDSELDRLVSEVSVEEISKLCRKLSSTINRSRGQLERSRELVSALEKWRNMDVPLDGLRTEGYEAQLWNIPEKEAEEAIRNLKNECSLCHLQYCSDPEGEVHAAVIIPVEDPEGAGDILKESGGTRCAFEGVSGSPLEVIEKEKAGWDGMREAIVKASEEASELAGIIDRLYILYDHYNESLDLKGIEENFYHTESTFLLEGWIRAIDRKRVEKALTGRFSDIELGFREPLEDEVPPVHLDNGALAAPAEFVTTLYGRPSYGEADPTPMLAPFFIFFFAMCLTDAGYGLTLSALTAFIILKFRPSGGAGKLMRLLFIGGLVTAVVGILAGGVFGLGPDSIPALKKYVFVNPLAEPMKVLNISFLLGLFHMIFGMGISMAQKMRARLIADAVFDNLFWMIFLVLLAPLGFSAILGGEVRPEIMFWAVRGALVMAVLIFVTGGRKKGSIIKKILGGLAGFYDIVGYFGDVLSYARLLALGLATSAIAIAVNDIAGMVIGMPMYVGYILAGLILLGGHTFNLAVNTLGGFVHSARLQYLEFFSKFFAGGGRPFEPFSSRRRYSKVKGNSTD